MKKKITEFGCRRTITPVELKEAIQEMLRKTGYDGKTTLIIEHGTCSISPAMHGVLCKITGDGSGHALPEIKPTGNQKFKAQLESYHSDAHVRVALEAQFKELWNRVEDGLPNDDRYVLVHAPNINLHEEQQQYVAFYSHPDTAWLVVNIGRVDGVTHWMDIIPPTESTTEARR